jgi:hypothetical protein
MKYIRTYKVIYSDAVLPKNETLNNGGRGQICAILKDNGIIMAPSYSSTEPEYGIKSRQKSNRTNIKVLKYRGKPAVKFEHTVDSYYKNVAISVIDEICNSGILGKGHFSYITENVVETEEYWRSLNGDYLMLRDLKFLGHEIDFNTYNMTLMLYPAGLEGEPITLTCRIIDQPSTQWSQFKKLNVLAFTITWDSKTVQRKEAIEEYLVQFPLSIIAQYQAKFEKTLAESGMGEYPPEFFDNVEIDCHFDAISESRSECTPDIINQVREAKNAKKQEMNE